MVSFRKYLKESENEHYYVIKFAMNPSKEQMKVLEDWLKAHNCVKSTPLSLVENDTLDFINVPNRQVYAMSIMMNKPVSQYILLQDIKIATNISEDLMIVRSIDEPVEIYAAEDAWSRTENKKLEKSGYMPAARLSTNREYLEAEHPPEHDLYGNEYNKKLLSYLAGVEKTRPSPIVEPSCPLFSWIKEDIGPGEPHQDTADFNAHIDTPKPTTKPSDVEPVDEKFLGTNNEISRTALPPVKFTKNTKTGKEKQVVKKVK